MADISMNWQPENHTYTSPALAHQSVIKRLIEYGCSNLTEKIEWPEGNTSVAVAGGFYDIYTAKLQGYTNPVAIKYAKARMEPLINEVQAISRLHHPNVLRFLGFVTDHEAFDTTGEEIPSDVGIVYPWVELNLRDYLTLNEDADRCHLCLQVAEGLVHLHNAGVIHGDLRTRNIMMSESSIGVIKITGFGGSVSEEETPDQSRVLQFSPRWASPERLDVHQTWPTRRSDVWSLGMTMLEILADDVPFGGLSEFRIISAIRGGRLPSRPQSFISLRPGYDDIIWGLLRSCWRQVPDNRPSAVAVRDILVVVEREGNTASKTNNAAQVTIKHNTSLPTMIERLVDHGCSDITTQLTYVEGSSIYSGKLSDVYQARLTSGALVAVKCLKALTNSDNRPDKVLKHTAHELYTWSVSTHPNILELIGLAVFRDKLAMVAPWMEYGSLLAYIRANPEADRCNMCTHIAEGLVYMHGKGIAHGDIKGDNVVVSKDGIAKITDFGCATMKREFPVAFTVTESLNYSVRWAAPELFLEDGASTFETDVYALGMTILEALTGDVPHQDRADLAVIHTVLVKKELPARPIECIPPQSRKGDELWATLERCWSHERERRPKMEELRDFVSSWLYAAVMRSCSPYVTVAEECGSRRSFGIGMGGTIE